MVDKDLGGVFELAPEAMQHIRRKRFSDLRAAIDNVVDMANKGTFPDSRLQVLATLVHATATVLVAEQIEDVMGVIEGVVPGECPL